MRKHYENREGELFVSRSSGLRLQARLIKTFEFDGIEHVHYDQCKYFAGTPSIQRKSVSAEQFTEIFQPAQSDSSRNAESGSKAKNALASLARMVGRRRAKPGSAR